MKFIIASIFTALLSFVTALFSPWWIITVVAFIVAAAIPQKAFLAFLSAAIALFLLWGIQAYLIDANNDHILATKIAGLLIHRNSSIVIVFITGVLGATVSGFAAAAGSLFRKVFFS
ncbi:MAG: hypothetical protein H7Y07_05350 [Pyrinomonadaceae bacterium]|nr:hypothetical protein [Sphingobacteriaceae bacterium]